MAFQPWRIATMRNIFFKSSLILALGLFLISSACTKKKKEAYDLDVSETLRWDIMTEPPTLDYIAATDTTSSRITDALMEGLARYTFQENDVGLEPALATTWEGSKDMKTWTFSLRDDVKWTDGVPFTAQHILDGWERLLNQDTKAMYANFLFNVKNAKAYYDRKIKNFSEVGVKINDKGQIVVQLEAPQSYFPSLMVHHSTWPIRKDIIAKYGDKWTEAGNYVGLGAYKLKIWDHDKAVVLERNDDYFGKKAKIKYILGRPITERSTALNMFKRGELDAMDEIPSIESQNLKTMKEYHLVPKLAMYYYGFNVTKPPTDDVRVRKAINMAIDKDEVNKVLGGEKIPANNILPPGLLGSDQSIGLKFNVEEAKKLLDEAGYKDRSKFPRIRLGFNTHENHQRLAENVQAQLKKNLGIEIELANEEWKTYIKSLESKKVYQFYRMGWVADYPDPDTFISLFVSNGGSNHTGWSNKPYDDLILKGVSEFDKEKRKQIYADALRIINEEEVPVIPLYHYRDQTLIHQRVKNYPQNVMHKFYVNETELVK